MNDKLALLQRVYELTEYVVSKAMISVTDHHDKAAWESLDKALKDVRNLEKIEKECRFLRES